MSTAVQTSSSSKTSGSTRRRQLRPRHLAQASSPARQQAALILEVLAGVRRPAEAAGALGISLVRYYQRERRALDGLLAACEPAPRGPRPDVARQVRKLQQERLRLERECGRQQALVRAVERSLGLAVAAAEKPVTDRKQKEEQPGANGKKRRRRRPTVRALKAARALRAEEPAPAAEHDAAIVTPQASAGEPGGGPGENHRPPTGGDV